MEYINLLIVGIITYITSVIFGPILIAYLKRLSVRQVVREEGLASHHKKTGTPVMGGFIFLLPSVVVTGLALIISKALSFEVIVIILATLLFGAIGFIDDYKKVIKRHNEGLTSKQKLILQILVGLPLALIASRISTEIWVPFTNIYLDLGWFNSIFVLIVVLATTNAVNLTDGVDGLSSSVTVIVLIFYTFISVKFGFNDFSIYAISLIGGLLGFLLFNKNPAKVFMGDVGSLALGGAVVSLAIFTNTLLLIPIVGVIYFVETLSVTLQVLYFKKTKKRIFKMTPIHHHFELGGWDENKIVKNFCIVSIIGVLVGVFSILPKL